MKAILALLAAALLLAGCTTPSESDDRDNDGGNYTGSDRGGEVSTQIEVVENESSSTSGNQTAANTSSSG